MIALTSFQGGFLTLLLITFPLPRVMKEGYRARILDRFFTYAKSHSDVWFARKDEIAKWVLSTPDITLKVDRAAAEISGLPSFSQK